MPSLAHRLRALPTGAVACIVLLLASVGATYALDPGARATPVPELAESAISAEADPGHLSNVVPGLMLSTLTVPDLGGAAHNVRVGVLNPQDEPVADVVFVHGHADRLDNHRDLFTAWADAGLRVVSLDLPSHGETDAGPIDMWSFGDLATLIGRVETVTRDGDRPLVLAGWSFGGLLATRIAQEPAFSDALSRPLSALIVENPAVVPLTFTGGDGISRLRALTGDLSAPVAGPPSPASPFLNPVFAGRLLAQAAIARSTPLPPGVPTLAVLSDPDKDQYVDPAGIRAWLEGVALENGAIVRITQCAGAKHGTDFEAWPIGPAARQAMVTFLEDTVGARPADLPSEVAVACN